MKKLIIALVAAFALTGAVYGAAAGLTVNGVDTLGSSPTEAVNSPDGNFVISDLVWSIDPFDITKVDGVTITVSEDALYDANNGDQCTVGVAVGATNDTATVTFTSVSAGGGNDSQTTPLIAVSPSEDATLTSVALTLTCDA